MKRKAIVYPIIILLLSLVIYLFYPENAEKDIKENSIGSSDFNYLPTSTTNAVVSHNYYTLSYNEKHEQAEWVAYELKNEHLSNTNRKRPYFIQDKKVKTQSADYRNYKNSGYTKGHLCPAGDRKFSKAAYDETFLTSNISPQKGDFNGGIWNRLEQKTRYWAGKDKQLFVVTGGVLEDNLPHIGQEKVTVPKKFYKILLDYSEPKIKAIAFLVPHTESKAPLYSFVVSIDSIEKLTNIDFFPALPNDLETKLEANSSYKDWSF
ncbi:DNA/RNA non-specific endonuclease [Aureibaculum sp. 2210JD6-5]|uniref:DNA/RNA non-specific endonuclease n=1 Tax=Aureibaculum sp. 2210JD6-5 TaxID=3103957 RepID=UPI002AADB4CB|nr:DNA/RNA non-specific endonuclease [Aureibaculum sp. 2210JD6-5]MDY7397006.1 DNA/RNA non-specific endonuclease [Aureibaculum sp. 2210JD6-5]